MILKPKTQFIISIIIAILYFAMAAITFDAWAKTFVILFKIEEWSNKLTYLMTMLSLLMFIIIHWTLKSAARNGDRAIEIYKEIKNGNS